MINLGPSYVSGGFTLPATKVVSASTSVALGSWTPSGSSTLSLTTPASLRKLQTGEAYRVEVVWTLSSGP